MISSRPEDTSDTTSGYSLWEIIFYRDKPDALSHVSQKWGQFDFHFRFRQKLPRWA